MVRKTTSSEQETKLIWFNPVFQKYEICTKALFIQMRKSHGVKLNVTVLFRSDSLTDTLAEKIVHSLNLARENSKET